jgi:hypothetical protein
MNVRRDRGSSLILAALRGFCLLIFSIYIERLPAGRQVGKRNRSGPPSRLGPQFTSEVVYEQSGEAPEDSFIVIPDCYPGNDELEIQVFL